MAVTIVIPTFNRSRKLLETIEALEQQDFKNFSVIVVDDGSKDDTQQVIALKEANVSFPLEYVRQENSGASAATNLGVSKAADGIVILFDDDILPDATTVTRHVKFHEAHPGSILSGSADTDPQRTVTDVQRYKLFMEEEWKKLRADAQHLIGIDFSNFIITTANMSFPRRVFMELGGFNTSLRDGYDVDFGFRALLAHVPLFFDRSVKSIHNDQISLRYYARRQKAYMDSKRIIFDRYPELQKKFNRDFEVRVPFFKRAVYRMLRLPLFVGFFESSAFPKLFPRSFRYRIYGSTIAALSVL